jgi:Domain of unknown function (DUF5615)
MYSPRIAEALRAQGHDVECVKERPELRGMPDEELLALMIGERRALLTEDVADFAPIAQQLATDGSSHYGLVFSSSSSMPRANSTIGVFIGALRSLLQRYPGENDLMDRQEWLSP